jgi:hypothetical protein
MNVLDLTTISSAPSWGLKSPDHKMTGGEQGWLGDS